MSLRKYLTVAALCCICYASSSTSNILSKIVMDETYLPLSATMAHFIAKATLTGPALWLFCPSTPRFSLSNWCVLFPFALVKIVTTFLTLYALCKVPLSYVITVKASSVPLWSVILTWLVLSERPSRRMIGALLLIGMGIILTTATEVPLESAALQAMLAAAAMSAGSLLVAQHQYSMNNIKEWRTNPLRFLEALNVLALVGTTPLWVWGESAALLKVLQDDTGGRVVVLLIIDAVLAWLQAVISIKLLMHLPPLSYAVMSGAKTGVVLIAALLVLRDPVSLLNIIGMSIAIMGVLTYKHAKVIARYEFLRTPVLPVCNVEKMFTNEGTVEEKT